MEKIRVMAKIELLARFTQIALPNNHPLLKKFYTTPKNISANATCSLHRYSF